MSRRSAKRREDSGNVEAFVCGVVFCLMIVWMFDALV